MLHIESENDKSSLWLRMTLEERWRKELEDCERWVPSSNLFGDTGSDIRDFEIYNWLYFLDNVNSLEDLLEGLYQLSPLADDALEVAEQMSKQDFRKFKKALAKEREGENRTEPRKYQPLLIPKRFTLGALVAEKFEVSLGMAVIQLMEFGEKY
jgi:hypothetical protein